MTLQNINDGYVKTYSLGIEKKYSGKKIEYENDCITLFFFYYPKHARVYIFNGKEERDSVPQVDGKVFLICQYQDAFCYRLKNLLDEKLYFEKLVFYFPPFFFYQLNAVLGKKNFRRLFDGLYDKYKKDYLDGLCISD